MSINMGITDWDYAMDLIWRLLPVLIPLLLVSLALTITAIVSIAKKPNPWNEKILWLLIVVFLDVIGPVIYFVLGSGMLDEKWAREQDYRDQMRGHDPYNSGGLS